VIGMLVEVLTDRADHFIGKVKKFCQCVTIDIYFASCLIERPF
jgi:hypothetical protein